MNKIFTALVISSNQKMCDLINNLVNVRYKNIRVKIKKEAEQFFHNDNIDILFIENCLAEPIINALTKSNVYTVLLKNKNESEKNISNNFVYLNNPFKPVALYLIIDNFLLPRQKNMDDKTQLTYPCWVNFKYLNIDILLNNYLNNREKIDRVLKLFPQQIDAQLTIIAELITKKNRSELIDETMSLSATFTYFAPEETTLIINNMYEYFAQDQIEKGEKQYEILLTKWEKIKTEILNF